METEMETRRFLCLVNNKYMRPINRKNPGPKRSLGKESASQFPVQSVTAASRRYIGPMQKRSEIQSS